MKQHTGMEAHDVYAPHSHEVRADHLGVKSSLPVNEKFINAQTGRPVQVLKVEDVDLLPGDLVIRTDKQELDGITYVWITVERKA